MHNGMWYEQHGPSWLRCLQTAALSPCREILEVSWFLDEKIAGKSPEHVGIELKLGDFPAERGVRIWGFRRWSIASSASDSKLGRLAVSGWILRAMVFPVEWWDGFTSSFLWSCSTTNHDILEDFNIKINLLTYSSRWTVEMSPDVSCISYKQLHAWKQKRQFQILENHSPGHVFDVSF